MINQIFAIRGATTIKSDTSEQIIFNSVELMSQIIKENNLTNKDFDIVSVIISTTADITAFYPARAIRESNLAPSVPLFSCLEPQIKNSLPLTIRLLLQISSKSDKIVMPKHVYLNDAKKLRQDLTEQ